MIIDTTKIWASVKTTYTYINKYHLVMMLLSLAIVIQGIVTQRLQRQVQTNKIVQDAVNDYEHALARYVYWQVQSDVWSDDTAIANTLERRLDDYDAAYRRVGVLSDSLGVVVVIGNDTLSRAKYVRDSVAEVRKNNR